MRVLVDVNLSPTWVGFLAANSIEARHWCDVGPPGAEDHEVMQWALAGGWIVLTHDLDFGALLALAGERGPSVIQVRTQDVLPLSLGPRVIAVLREHEREIALGAIVVLDDAAARLRLLPIRSRLRAAPDDAAP